MGQVKSSEVGQYLSRATLFVRPSRSEGLGNAFLEAMAAGLPVVGTPVGGIPDFLKTGETGWLCQVNDPESIAQKVTEILDERNKSEVNRIIATEKKMVIDNYDWSRLAGQFNALLSRLKLGK